MQIYEQAFAKLSEVFWSAGIEVQLDTTRKSRTTVSQPVLQRENHLTQGQIDIYRHLSAVSAYLDRPSELHLHLAA